MSWSWPKYDRPITRALAAPSGISTPPDLRSTGRWAALMATLSGRTTTSTAPRSATVGREPPELAVDHVAVGHSGQDVGGAEELGGPPRLGVVVDVLGRAGLLDAAVAHHHDLVGERERLLLVVGHEQGTGAGRSQDRHDLLAQRLAEPGVERGERLVEQDDLGIRGQSTGQRHALALTARQLVRVRAGPVGQPDQRQALVDPPGGGLAERRRWRRP